MNITRAFLLLAIGFLSGQASAQGEAAAAPGTYQLMTTEPKKREVFTTDLRVEIEAHRQQHISILYRVGTVTWVRILARDVIDAPGFIPLLPEEIVVVDPSAVQPEPHLR